MARLTNVKSGAVVEVRDEKVELLGSDWKPADEKKSAPAKKAAASKSDSK